MFKLAGMQVTGANVRPSCTVHARRQVTAGLLSRGFLVEGGLQRHRHRKALGRQPLENKRPGRSHLCPDQ